MFYVIIYFLMILTQTFFVPQGDLVNNATAAPVNMSLWNQINTEMEKKFAAMEAEHKKIKKLSEHIAEVREAGGILKWKKMQRKPPPMPQADIPKTVKNIKMFEPPWLKDRRKSQRENIN